MCVCVCLCVWMDDGCHFNLMIIVLIKDLTITAFFFVSKQLLKSVSVYDHTHCKTAICAHHKCNDNKRYACYIYSCHQICTVNLAHSENVQLPKLRCHWCSLVSNSVLTGCVMRCAGPVLQPGSQGWGGSSTVVYSRGGYHEAVM